MKGLEDKGINGGVYDRNACFWQMNISAYRKVNTCEIYKTYYLMITNQLITHHKPVVKNLYNLHKILINEWPLMCAQCGIVASEINWSIRLMDR